MQVLTFDDSLDGCDAHMAQDTSAADEVTLAAMAANHSATNAGLQLPAVSQFVASVSRSAAALHYRGFVRVPRDLGAAYRTPAPGPPSGADGGGAGAGSGGSGGPLVPPGRAGSGGGSSDVGAGGSGGSGAGGAAAACLPVGDARSCPGWRDLARVMQSLPHDHVRWNTTHGVDFAGGVPLNRVSE